MAEQRQKRTRSSTAPTRPRPTAERGPEAAAKHACQRLEGLISQPAEGVSAVVRNGDGWCVAVDVLEVARIPDTTSLLATYEVEIDSGGELAGYRRIRRYRRGAADE